MSENILITSALPYINNVPHIGNIIGSHFPADVYARFHRIYGNNVTFIGGADEHGTPAVINAKALGVTPRELVDKLKEIHKQIYKKLNISYDNFSGTSIPLHHKLSRDFFNKLKENGYIEKGEVNMYYCPNCQMFLPDRFVRGTCPKCGYDDAYGDCCEKCDSSFNGNELLNPHCHTCGMTPEIRKSEHYYFNLTKASPLLDEWIESKKDVFKPYVYSEAKRWIKEGLTPRCITRDMSWGIPVEENGNEDKVFYVWFEAPIGYISFTKELGDELYNTLWKDKSSKIYNFIGKDNIPFHSVFFPAMLLANGEYNLPYDVAGLNFLNYEGQKFSKSKRIGVFCTPLLDSDIEIDALRGYLISIMPETKDSDWKWEEFKNNTNSELIGKFGNFFNRTINLLYKNFPTLDVDINSIGELDEQDRQMIENLQTMSASVVDNFLHIKFRDAYKQLMNLSVEANTYLEHKAPWTLIKNENFNEAKKVLYICLNICKSLAILGSPIMPEKMQEVWQNQLKFDGKVDEKGNLQNVGKITVEINHTVGQPQPLFRRIDDDYLNELKEHFSNSLEIETLFK
ncbi:MAG: methionine--tRNA ligase [Christensenellales bacterium]